MTETSMSSSLLQSLSTVLTAADDDAVAAAALTGWQAAVPADYHSMMRRSAATGIIDFWNPYEGRLDSSHWLVKLFATLWSQEDPAGTHPSVIAFLKNGPGAYLRSLLEPDEVWHRRAHYRIVDSAHGMRDMISIFLEPRPGTLVALHAGSKQGHFPAGDLPPAERFCRVLSALLAARGGFPAQRCNRIELLTSRERQVLRLVQKGRRNLQIAEELGISPLTVRKHLENIFGKLSVDNRTAAAALLDPDSP